MRSPMDRLATLALAASALAGCAAGRGDDGPSPMAERAARAAEGDLSLVPDLFDSLDSPDPGERAFAHQTLLRLSAAWGRNVDFGYRPWAPREERLERIAEIRAYWRRWKIESDREGKGD